jgi:hypothetical protein
MYDNFTFEKNDDVELKSKIVLRDILEHFLYVVFFRSVILKPKPIQTNLFKKIIGKKRVKKYKHIISYTFEFIMYLLSYRIYFSLSNKYIDISWIYNVRPVLKDLDKDFLLKSGVIKSIVSENNKEYVRLTQKTLSTLNKNKLFLSFKKLFVYYNYIFWVFYYFDFWNDFSRKQKLKISSISFNQRIKKTYKLFYFYLKDQSKFFALIDKIILKVYKDLSFYLRTTPNSSIRNCLLMLKSDIEFSSKFEDYKNVSIDFFRKYEANKLNSDDVSFLKKEISTFSKNGIHDIIIGFKIKEGQYLFIFLAYKNEIDMYRLYSRVKVFFDNEFKKNRLKSRVAISELSNMFNNSFHFVCSNMENEIFFQLENSVFYARKMSFGLDLLSRFFRKRII